MDRDAVVPHVRAPRIALLTAHLRGAPEEEQWLGAAGAAARLGVGLLAVVGSELAPEGADDPCAVANDVFDLVAPPLRERRPHAAAGPVDAYLLRTPQLRARCGPAMVRRWAHRLTGVPVVSVGEPLPGAVHLGADERGGSRELAGHLARGHGLRRIAFVRGPASDPVAAGRHRGYLDAVAAHGLPRDPVLTGPVLPGPDPASPRLRRWLHALLASPARPDAVMAAGDRLAGVVLQVAAALGLRVPEDLAVTGAADPCRGEDPAGGAQGPRATGLTTTRPPAGAAGRRGVELLAGMLAGAPAPAEELLPCEVLRLGSCGCPEPVAVQGGDRTLERRSRRVHEAEHRLVTAGTPEGVAAVLAAELAPLGLRTAHLVVHDTASAAPPDVAARLLTAAPGAQEPPVFGVRELVPAPVWRSLGTAPQVLLPLHFAGVRHGHLLAGPAPGPQAGWLHETLAASVSTGLEAALARRRRLAAQQDMERRVAERTGELAGAVEQLAAENRELRAQVAERQRAERQLAHQVMHDPLTGLANRRMLQEHLEGAVARLSRHGVPVAVLFCDLDDFKWVNDHLGHAAGDDLLRQLARRLRHALRPEDLVARFAGDEFVVVPTDVATARDVVAIARRVLAECAGGYRVGGAEVQVRLSLGLTLATRPPTTTDDLLREADSALYLAKRRGKNSVAVFDGRLQEQINRRADLESGLRSSLHDGSLCVLYQPKVDLRTGRVAGVEALLRWRHPERGLLAPPDFLDVAEESNLIVEIGEWVLRRVCAEARTLVLPDGTPPLVQVNLAARQLGDPMLVERLHDILDRSGLNPRRLVVEVSESRSPGDLRRTREALLRLRGLGVHVALDDFGVGASSLQWLQQLPVDEVKLDRRLIRDIDSDEQDRRVVSSVIDLAHAMGHVVVAEGVESTAQCEHLVAAGCDYGQGFHFARPVPGAELGRALGALRV
ncbi:hypothetical protein NUM3379_11230 [Kineococcus sp. NUM-3379]